MGVLVEEGIKAPAPDPQVPPANLKRGRRLRGLTAASGPRARLLFNLLTVVVTVAFSYVALSAIKLDQVAHALRTSNYWWLVPAFAVFVLSNVARALRWQSLFAPGRRPPLWGVAYAMLIGYLYNNILPARAGEAARVVVLNQRCAAPPAEIVGTVVLERLYDVLAILVIFFVAEPWLPHVSWFATAALAAIALAATIVTAAIVFAVYGDRPLRLLMRPLARVPLFSGERLDRIVAELVHGLSGLRHPGVAIAAFVWTAVSWLLSALAAWLVMLAFPLHLPFGAGILVVVAVGLGMILPSPPAAVGVFEGASLIGLKAYGVSKSAALPFALVLHTLNFVPFVLVGALLVHHNARHPSAARRRAAQPSAGPGPSAG